MALARGKGQNCLQFWRVWESLSIRPFCILLVTNKTVLCFQKGTSDSSHIPQPAIAGLGFAPNGVNAFSSPQNFDSPFGLPQDDTLTLETLWLFVTLSNPARRAGSRGTEPLCPSVTLSKRGSYLLRLHTAIHLRARRTDNCGVSSIVRQKMPAFFEGMGCFSIRPSRSLCY